MNVKLIAAHGITGHRENGERHNIKAGEPFECSKAEAERLIRLGAARPYLTRSSPKSEEVRHG